MPENSRMIAVQLSVALDSFLANESLSNLLIFSILTHTVLDRDSRKKGVLTQLSLRQGCNFGNLRLDDVRDETTKDRSTVVGVESVDL